MPNLYWQKTNTFSLFERSQSNWQDLTCFYPMKGWASLRMGWCCGRFESVAVNPTTGQAAWCFPKPRLWAITWSSWRPTGLVSPNLQWRAMFRPPLFCFRWFQNYWIESYRLKETPLVTEYREFLFNWFILSIINFAHFTFWLNWGRNYIIWAKFWENCKLFISSLGREGGQPAVHLKVSAVFKSRRFIS